MDIIQYNPYRILGVYSNSTTKERLANLNRTKAFLKVGKSLPYPLDLLQFCAPANRTEAIVADADARLTLPKDQMLYAQFWFIKVTPLDEVAFKHLMNGDMNKAEEIWQKKECASSLQNRMVCALIREDLGCAISCAEKLYGSSLYVKQFISSITGDASIMDATNLGLSFIDSLCTEVDVKDLLAHISFNNWRSHIVEHAVKTLTENIQNSIDIANKAKGKGADVRFNAGKTLKDDCEKSLLQLKSLLPETDLQYQMIADKFGLEVLQCGIDYYNESEEFVAAYKAMDLAKYAQCIVVGQAAKNRCDENIQILKRIINKLPPLEVIEHHEAIQGYLKSFAQKGDLICHSIQLIKDCAPHIVAIKEKLGNGHPYYLKISTTVANEALGNVIAEVNAAQERDFEVLKRTLITAWRTQLYLDKFDLEPEYKNGRFIQCKQALFDIIEKCKGFENPVRSFMYTHGCGWCYRLDVNDLDMRTDEELYKACHDLADYNAYLRRFPDGKHAKVVKDKVEWLAFQAASSVESLDSFIRQYTNGKYTAQAKVKLAELKAEIARQDATISRCKTTSEVVRFFRSEHSSVKDFSDRCSSKAFSLAKSEDDYRQIVATFGERSAGGIRAKDILNQIELKRKKKAKRKSRIIKWTMGILIPIAILSVIYLTNGADGLSSTFFFISAISGLATVGAFMNLLKEDADSPWGFAVFLTVTFIAVVLGGTFDDIAHEKTTSRNDTVVDSIAADSTCVADDYNPSNQNIDNKQPQKTQEEIDYDTYINNQLKTGAKPYKKYYKSHTGSNYLDFRTSGCDYVIIVKNYSNSRVVNHVYVRAGETGRMYLPNGTYNIFFYGGSGWNPNKVMKHVRGGFVSENGSIQKDEHVELYDQCGEYTLYPVQNGNLHLEMSSEDEALSKS